MKAPELLTLLVFVPVSIFVAFGSLLLTRGHSISRHWVWVSRGLLFVSIIYFCWILFGVMNKTGDDAVTQWFRGWVGKTFAPTGFRVGFMRDHLSIVSSACACLIGLAVLNSEEMISKTGRFNRSLAGLFFSVAGLVVVSFALTPWTGLLGLVLIFFGSSVGLSGRWERSNDETSSAFLFLGEFGSGVALLSGGIALLASGGSSLRFDEFLTSSGGGSVFGSILVFIGWILLLKPLPVGWIVVKEIREVSFRLILGQLIPGFATLLLFVKIMSSGELLTNVHFMGWLFVVASIASGVMGILNFRKSFAPHIWTSASFSLCSTMVLLSGSMNGFSLLVGILLGTSSFCISTEFLVKEKKPANDLKLRLAQACVFLSVAASTGMIGFVASRAMINHLGEVWNQPVLLGASVLSIVIVVSLGWILAWRHVLDQKNVEASWIQLSAPLILLLASLAIWWTGTITGGALTQEADRVFPSFLEAAFTKGLVFSTYSNFTVLMFLVLVLFSPVVAYWLYFQIKDSQKSLYFEVLNRSAAIARIVFKSVSAGVLRVDRFVSNRLWKESVSDRISGLLQFGSHLLALLDTRTSARLNQVSHHLSAAPTKAIQIIHSGNIQWYVIVTIFFAVAFVVKYIGGF